LRTVSKIILVAWTLAASAAAAQICFEAPASHHSWQDLSADGLGALGDRGNPTESDDDCPPVPPAAVDAGSGDWGNDLLAAFAAAPALHVQTLVPLPAPRADRSSLAVPALIPVYFVAHRLRF